jgi:hypothetical protein
MAAAQLASYFPAHFPLAASAPEHAQRYAPTRALAPEL